MHVLLDFQLTMQDYSRAGLTSVRLFRKSTDMQEGLDLLAKAMVSSFFSFFFSFAVLSFVDIAFPLLSSSGILHRCSEHSDVHWQATSSCRRPPQVFAHHPAAGAPRSPLCAVSSPPHPPKKTPRRSRLVRAPQMDVTRALAGEVLPGTLFDEQEGRMGPFSISFHFLFVAHGARGMETDPAQPQCFL